MGERLSYQYFDPEEIELVYKAEPPYTEVDGGFGFVGCLKRRKEDDRLECHECGEWYLNLGRHVNSHGLTATEYKIRYGLKLKSALCSREMSFAVSTATSKRMKRMTNAEIMERLTKMRSGLKSARATKKYRRAMTYARRSPAHNNTYALCPEQIHHRYQTVADQAGREPTMGDIKKYDSELLWGINSRYGGMRAYRRTIGANPDVYIPRGYTETRIIGVLRKFEQENGRLPTKTDFIGGRPNGTTIVRHFGSWRRAMVNAFGERHAPPKRTSWTKQAIKTGIKKRALELGCRPNYNNIMRPHPGVIANHFGSFKAGVDAALGIKTPGVDSD